ncbi:glutathione S-transferase family protein [Pararobbsia silviterrae]|uniref:Glutathione S-transferase n=1 Tax=Pararobbsia silviterrae TaxID=1792498 RepID=A0A494XMH5_9BURK|nr:glutathione S-transferase [Pararobbsia silviterrae]RKP51905.1 glutathione S-transferase [Pararobbsia silviterrae]
MKLIGMLDSPYVRRVAIALKLLGIEFEHQSLSVFRHFDAFGKINPVVKAPTLIEDDGRTLMDSSLILDYVLSVKKPDSVMLPHAPAERFRANRVIGLALAASEKAIQIVYERNLRPEEKQHAPWVDRVRGQLHAAFDELERELEAQPFALDERRFGVAGITVAVVWYFVAQFVADAVPADAYPTLRAFSAFAEQQPTFVATPAE